MGVGERVSEDSSTKGALSGHGRNCEEEEEEEEEEKKDVEEEEPEGEEDE